MEYIDILDKNGKPIGKSKPKSEVHRDGDWHRTVHVWIVNSKGELLLQKRAQSKENYPGLWDISVAGHLSAGDDNISAALREAREELGLELPKENLQYLFDIIEEADLNQGAYIDNEYESVYLVEKDVDISQIVFKDGEVEEVRLLSFEELEKTLSANPKDCVPHKEEYRLLFQELHKRYM